MNSKSMLTRLERLEQHMVEHDEPELLAFGETVTIDELQRAVDYSRQHPDDRDELTLTKDPRDMATADLWRLARPLIERVRRENA